MKYLDNMQYHVAQFRFADAEECTRRGCIIHTRYDLLRRETILRHGDDPEAVLVIEDIDMDNSSIDELHVRIQKWLNETHAYLDSKAPEGVLDEETGRIVFKRQDDVSSQE